MLHDDAAWLCGLVDVKLQPAPGVQAYALARFHCGNNFPYGVGVPPVGLHDRAPLCDDPNQHAACCLCLVYGLCEKPRGLVQY